MHAVCDVHVGTLRAFINAEAQSNWVPPRRNQEKGTPPKPVPVPEVLPVRQGLRVVEILFRVRLGDVPPAALLRAGPDFLLRPCLLAELCSLRLEFLLHLGQVLGPGGRPRSCEDTPNPRGTGGQIWVPRPFEGIVGSFSPVHGVEETRILGCSPDHYCITAAYTFNSSVLTNISQIITQFVETDDVCEGP